MSKVDAMRALREARMTAQAQAQAPAAATPVRRSTQAKEPVRAPRVEAEAPAEADGQACGHRNMGGKSCTRPAGHSEKNHRYG